MVVLPGNIVDKKCSSCSSVVAACNRAAEKMEGGGEKAPLKDQMVRFDRRNCPIVLTVIISQTLYYPSGAGTCDFRQIVKVDTEIAPAQQYPRSAV